jgi:large subunit ribosomal protein L7Ae
MPKSKKKSSRGRAKPYDKKKAVPKPSTDPLYPSTPRNFRIGGDIRHKTDMSRMVKWPRYIRVQRQRKILYTRLKVPPQIAQFTRCLSKDQAREVFMLLNKYKPESKADKKARIKEAAQAKAAGEAAKDSKKPMYVQFGLNHVTTLIERKKAKLVVIAHDVAPIELVIWMPTLCRKLDVPYCIVKSKSRLGQLVDKKTATCVAITAVGKSDMHKLDSITDMCKTAYNNNTDALKVWGGGVMGLKTQRKLAARQKAIDVELAKKAQF